MSLTAYQIIQQTLSSMAISIYRPGRTQQQYLIQSADELHACSLELQKLGCYLVSMIANDERELEDHCFKIYHLFSHPTENDFVTIEFSIKEGQVTYPSLAKQFFAAEVFEREIADLFGLYPEQAVPHPLHQAYLHNSYPEGLNPLRRDWSQETVQRILNSTPPVPTVPPHLTQAGVLKDGQLFMPVGPIHAGVIEPGGFLFRLSGETVDQLDIQLGYAHKGIERLFQNSFSIPDGWRLAEKVSGDTSFAHSLAYCKAVESLVQAALPMETHLIRSILLELERMLNHINDCGALAHDLALDVPASDLAVLRERLARLCALLTGSRFLRGVNRPGGVRLPAPLNSLKHTLLFEVHAVAEAFLELSNMLILRSDFRDRTINVGVLPLEAALCLGVSGLAGRASGLKRDFRLQHPFGAYSRPDVQELISQSAELADLPLSRASMTTGDVFSRFVQRVIEVNTAELLIEKFVGLLSGLPGEEKSELIQQLDFRRVPNYETGLGFVEGWRGDIVYWLMKDKFDRIFRCKVRDPSLLNWPGLREAVAPVLQGKIRSAETALADFPVINKSFNLSYSEVDL